MYVTHVMYLAVCVVPVTRKLHVGELAMEFCKICDRAHIPNEMWCKPCETSELTNVVGKRCFCGRGCAVFGEAGGKAVFCKYCKTPEMVNVRRKR